MNSERLWLCNAIHLFIADMLRSQHVGDYDGEEAFQGFVQLVDAAVVVLVWEHDNRAPDCRAEADLYFEAALEGCTPAERARAHAVRNLVLSTAAEKASSLVGPQRGSDPACCDPGGGVRSPDEIEDDEQF